VASHRRAKPGRRWLTRFNADGGAGLTEAFRSERPATYTPGPVAEVMATARTDPQPLHFPWGRWTLERFAEDRNAPQGLPLTRSRLEALLIAEGLRGRQQEPWFGERVAPDCATNSPCSRGQVGAQYF
jgi:transposase